jgi:deoxyribonuclease V
VKINQFHNWQLNREQAKQLQRDLATHVVKKNELIRPHYIAGSDISAPDSHGIAHAAVVLLEYPGLKIIEVQMAEDKLAFPYIPGLLSFREMPLILAAFEKLSSEPDIILVDGQGIAHPRRFGIASHLGLILNIPTIGCAKSHLCGRHEPLVTTGSTTDLIDNDEVIGSVLLTKSKTKPIYVSIGYKIDLPSAVFWVKACCKGYRLPEPCRLAHIAASGKQLNQKHKKNLYKQKAI